MVQRKGVTTSINQYLEQKYGFSEEAQSIERIKNIIENIGDAPQTKLFKDIADNTTLSTREIPKLLEKYNGRHWENRYEKTNNRTTWVLL